MVFTLINILAFGSYLAATGFLYRRLYDKSDALHVRKICLLLGTVAVISHGYVLYTSIFSGHNVHFSLPNVFSLVTWIAASILLLSGLRQSVHGLGILLYPLAALAIALAWLISGESYIVETPSPAATAHIAIGIFAFGLLILAVAQAIVLIIQERHFHQREPALLIASLPPLETMELFLLRLTIAGFALLTLTLLSGLLFSGQVFGHPLEFNHHIVLSICAWVVFGLLLAGRARFGWRGSQAGYWTIAGFVMLTLAYFGTRLVLEVILGKSA